MALNRCVGRNPKELTHVFPSCTHFSPNTFNSSFSQLKMKTRHWHLWQTASQAGQEFDDGVMFVVDCLLVIGLRSLAAGKFTGFFFLPRPVPNWQCPLAVRSFLFCVVFRILFVFFLLFLL